MDQIAKSLGFESAAEMNNMVASVVLSTPEMRDRFETWKMDDGSKSGLFTLLEYQEGKMPKLEPLNTRRDPNLKCPKCRSVQISLVDVAFDSKTGEMHQTGNTHQCDECLEYFQYLPDNKPCAHGWAAKLNREMLSVSDEGVTYRLTCSECKATWTIVDDQKLARIALLAVKQALTPPPDSGGIDHDALPPTTRQRWERGSAVAGEESDH